jgi:predicted nucleic acid-binding protein
VKILDTNLWVFGTLRTNEQAAEWLAEIDRGETTSAINAYMVQEALAAFDRTQSLSSADRDTVKTRFLTRLTRMTGLIEAPSSRDVSDALLREQRSAPAVQTLARVCGIQPKDVPILVLAFEHRDREPTILTNDESFAAFEPAAHSLPELSIEHVP